MLRRQSLLFKMTLLTLLVTRASSANDQTELEKQQSAPKALVMMTQGESKELQFCWDEGTGRAPVVLLSSKPMSPEEVTQKVAQENTRYESGGLSIEFNEDRSSDLQAALYQTGKFTGRQSDGSYKHVTVVAVRLVTRADAVPGAHSVLVQVVSGTGRSMRLVGEFRVLVRE
ncbi:hypothetical protein [Aporhodopirellula aestuarii]|uniref:Uncharacterized protein n=1 Tax=Aporhodopirellula aestuarii TaxID=2950107 RepID=A0ABT0U6G6_9BACT|nr:hypothetical protein [Aporhodopirellula aestuarii]MCM2372532.1 hypothetical protein [Aporhodopirellula aestuarii]